MGDEIPDESEPLDCTAPDTTEASPDDSSGGAKLFVIFFLAIVPLLGIAIVAMVLYGFLMR